MAREKKIECLDVIINYIDEGEGIPMVFIHNGGSFYQIWVNQIEHFRHDYRVIALDLPGFGDSSESTHPYTLDYYYDIMIVFLQKLGVDKVILVGNCIGSTIAIKYKTHNPLKVIKLILVNICPGERLVPSKILKQALFSPKPKLITEVLKRTMGFFLTRWPAKNRFPDILFGSAPDRSSEAYRKFVAGFKEPGQTRSRVKLYLASDTFTLDRTVKDNTSISDSLLIWGEHNKVADLGREGYYHKELCGIERINIIDKAGHMLVYESPIEVNRLIREFIGS